MPKTLKAATPAEVFGNVVEHAATGFKLPETIARRIEDSAKGLPAEFAYMRIAKSPEKFDLNPGERADVSVITTSDPDREGDVILPEGGDWNEFNRVVPAFHKYDQLPVAACAWMKPKGNGIIAKSIYYSRPDSWGEAWLPDAIVHLQRQSPPGMTAKSVGILPTEVRSATAEEKSINPNWKDKRIISKWKGFEYSVCAIPMNAQAEMIAVARALKSFGDSKSAARLAEMLDIKDLDCAIMPKCPKCMKNESVMPKEGSAGVYQCAACNHEFTRDEDGDAVMASLQAAFDAPYITEATARVMAQKRQDELARHAADEAARKVQAAFWLLTGKV